MTPRERVLAQETGALAEIKKDYGIEGEDDLKDQMIEILREDSNR